MIKILSTSLMLLLLSIPLWSQNDLNPCGTTDGKSEWLIKYQANPHLFEKSDTPLNVALAIHIVGDNNGNGYFPKSKVFDALCVLNEAFEPANIHFYTTTDFSYIDNSNYYEHSFSQGANMMNNYYTPNKIDCYIVADPAGNCGYSSYGNGVALAKGCLSPTDQTWAHELGHYMSLPHTFYGWEGYEHDYTQPAPTQVNGVTVELVDGSNCDYAADGFCDTPPDYLNDRWSCTAQGRSSQVQHDPSGAAFTSDGSFFMSYSNGACKTRFSDEQIAAMRANLENEQPYLLTEVDALEDISTPLVLSFPIQGENAPINGNELTLNWEEVENATGYLVQINPFPNFGSAIIETYTSTPEITVSDLEIGKKYYWRVRAFSEWSSCSDFSASTSFKVATPTAINELDEIHQVKLLPNPSITGQNIKVQFYSEKQDMLTFSILNVQGKQINQTQITAPIGRQTFSIPTNELKQGIYFLQIQSPKGYHYEKFVIQ